MHWRWGKRLEQLSELWEFKQLCVKIDSVNDSYNYIFSKCLPFEDGHMKISALTLDHKTGHLEVHHDLLLKPNKKIKQKDQLHPC